MSRIEFFIALRYLFAKKSHRAINWVSGISVGGVATATAAMICILSVFNGFKGLVESLFTAFDPELIVERVSGQPVAADHPSLQALRQSPAVSAYAEVLSDQALLRWEGRQTVVTLMGVDDNWPLVSDVETTLIGWPQFSLFRGTLPTAVCGLGVARELELPFDFERPLEVWAPKHGERVNMATPANSFRHQSLAASGSFFSVGQGKYDDRMVLVDIGFARTLFDREGQVTAVALCLADGHSADEVRAVVGADFAVRDRYQQQADTFRIMNIEKLIAYLFFAFVLLIAAFNIVGSLSMLIIEKRDDAQTLRALGASDTTLRRIFTIEGWLIGLLGAVIGLAVGLTLCWLQIQFGLISLGGSEGSFIINAYPVVVDVVDVAVVFVTVLAVSWLTVLWPVHHSVASSGE